MPPPLLYPADQENCRERTDGCAGGAEQGDDLNGAREDARDEHTRYARRLAKSFSSPRRRLARTLERVEDSSNLSSPTESSPKNDGAAIVALGPERMCDTPNFDFLCTGSQRPSFSGRCPRL